MIRSGKYETHSRSLDQKKSKKYYKGGRQEHMSNNPIKPIVGKVIGYDQIKKHFHISRKMNEGDEIKQNF